jgi:hypothetical protein
MLRIKTSTLQEMRNTSKRIAELQAQLKEAGFGPVTTSILLDINRAVKTLVDQVLALESDESHSLEFKAGNTVVINPMVIAQNCFEHHLQMVHDIGIGPTYTVTRVTEAEDPCAIVCFGGGHEFLFIEGSTTPFLDEMFVKI